MGINFVKKFSVNNISIKKKYKKIRNRRALYLSSYQYMLGHVNYTVEDDRPLNYLYVRKLNILSIKKY